MAEQHLFKAAEIKAIDEFEFHHPLIVFLQLFLQQGKRTACDRNSAYIVR